MGSKNNDPPTLKRIRTAALRCLHVARRVGSTQAQSRDQGLAAARAAAGGTLPRGERAQITHWLTVAWDTYTRRAPYVPYSMPGRAERIETRTRCAVERAHGDAGFRTTEHGHETIVRCGGVASAQSTVGTCYPGDFGLPNSYNYQVACSTHTLTVPHTWLVRVAARGIAIVDGLVTLDAVQISPGIYRAIWVRQGRGTSLVEEHGVLCRDGLEFSHGRDVVQARATLARRVRLSERARAEKAEDEVARAAAAFAEIGLAVVAQSVLVTASDSTAAGNCASGTLDWAERHVGGRTSAPVSAVIHAALAVGDRVDLATRACRVAVIRATTAK